MFARFVRAASVAALGLSSFATSALAADVGSRQTLDTVAVHTPRNVLEMQFDAPVRPPDFILSNIVSNGASPGTFVTCKLTATRGLFCLDGDRVRQWQLPIDAATEGASFSCRSALAASPRKSDNCTGLTVDEQGALWVVGLKGNTHSVIKLVETGAACVAPARGVPGTTYCATDYYSGRPPVVDVDTIGGDVAEQFIPCPDCGPQSGVLALESRRDVTFFPDPIRAAGPVTVGPADGWGLRDRQESLLSTTLLQVPFGDGVVNFVVVTTSAGRVLARNVAAGGVQTIFDIPAERAQPAAAPNALCASTGPQYAIRSSSTSGTVYLTDRNYCEVLALRPVISASADPARPTLVLDNLASGTQDFTLSTSAAFPPAGVTVAPGVSIDLSECAADAPCQVVGSASGKPAAAISSVELQPGSPSGVTLFQVTDVPDCRYRNYPGFDPAQRTACETILADQATLESQGKLNPGDRLIVKLATGTPFENHPATQLLNLKPLLPKQITSLYKPGQVPPLNQPLLISNQYRGQADRQFVFDAMYAIAEPGVRFNGSFLFAFDVPLLDDPSATPEQGRRCQPSDGGRSLQDWDVMTRVSENHPSVGGRFIDTLTNVDCINPSMSEEVSFSALPYTLELAPDTWDETRRVVVEQNDALFARLVQKLYADLEAIRAAYVCPASGSRLLSNPVCAALKSSWDNGKQKLDKCIEAAFQPKSSQGDENCQSFLSQLKNYRAGVPLATPTADVANRVGELRSRTNVIQHVFETRFLPSITPAGFCRETQDCAKTPWPVGSP